MRQTAAEQNVEWTNFRSAWIHFITAHKLKVSSIRRRAQNVLHSSGTVYHQPARPCRPATSGSSLTALQTLKWNLFVMFPNFSLYFSAPLFTYICWRWLTLALSMFSAPKDRTVVLHLTLFLFLLEMFFKETWPIWWPETFKGGRQTLLWCDVFIWAERKTAVDCRRSGWQHLWGFF